MQLLFERIVANDDPESSHAFSTDWYYYVFAKPDPDHSGVR
jgi:hypothetical protein